MRKKYGSVKEREASFDGVYKAGEMVYWHLSTPSGETMAINGFYFDPTKTHMDRVGCFTCKVKEFGWAPGATEPPSVRHLRNSPECPYSRVLSSRHLHESEGLGWDENDLFASVQDSADIRHQTFKMACWPHERNKKMPSSRELAENGFYYASYEKGDDTTTCMYCGTSLEGWEAGDSVAEEHRKRRPDCYVFAGRRRSGVYSRRASDVNMDVVEISDVSVERVIQELPEGEDVGKDADEAAQKEQQEEEADRQLLDNSEELVDAGDLEKVAEPKEADAAGPQETEVAQPVKRPAPVLDDMRLEEEIVEDESVEGEAEPVEIPMSTLNELEDLFFVEDSRRSSTFFNRSRSSFGERASEAAERQLEPVREPEDEKVPEPIEEEHEQAEDVPMEHIPDFSVPELEVPDSQSIPMGIEESLREIKQLDPVGPADGMDMLDESTRDDILMKETGEPVEQPERQQEEQLAEDPSSKKRKKHEEKHRKHHKRKKAAKEKEREKERQKEAEKKRKKEKRERKKEKEKKRKEKALRKGLKEREAEKSVQSLVPAETDSAYEAPEPAPHTEPKKYVEELVETDFSEEEMEPKAEHKMESIEEEDETKAEEEKTEDEPNAKVEELQANDDDENEVLLDDENATPLPEVSRVPTVSPAGLVGRDVRVRSRLVDGRIISSDDPLSFRRRAKRRARKLKETPSKESKDSEANTLEKAEPEPESETNVARERTKLAETGESVALYERHIFPERVQIYEQQDTKHEESTRREKDEEDEHASGTAAEPEQLQQPSAEPPVPTAQDMDSSPNRALSERRETGPKDGLQCATSEPAKSGHSLSNLSLNIEHLSENQSTPEVSKGPLWEPIKKRSHTEEFNEAIKYTQELLDSDYRSLNDDLEGKLTSFVAEMPEEELEMTLKEWINYQADQAAKLVAQKTEDMVRGFREDAARALKVLESLPVAEETGEDVVF
ncbi:hypothetical protein KL914_005001 [Ogataea haglerorum]|nr:hypothetical protein KL914_005001 [Ogataea haglerorum]